MSNRPAGRLRIIGGRWRSRVIDFADDGGVRPTPDRVRQTLFDWLAPMIDGAQTLDLFAGSGALGLEALSRGAVRASFVEQGLAQATAIRTAAAKLQAGSSAEIVQAEAINWLRNTPQRYDLVFVDPPYASPLLEMALLALPRVLASFNRIYLEWPHGQTLNLPAGYTLLKEKSAGRVSYGLASCTQVEGRTS